MNNLGEFAVLAALIIGGFGLFAFMFQRLEGRLDTRINALETEMRDGFKELRRDLAEEFRTQRAEVAAQVTAISNAIIASRRSD
jgi:hypothetical protein